VSVVGSAKIDSAPFALLPPRVIWTLALNSPLTVPPAFDAERAYFGIDGERLVAYTIADGAQLWLVSARPLTQPAAGDDLVFCVEPDELVARRVSDGSVAWRQPLSDALSAPVVWHGGWLIAVTAKGSALMYRATDGQLLWQREIGSPAHAPPAAAVDRLYIPTGDGRVVALRVDTGEPVWDRRLGGPANDVLVLDDRLYVGSMDNFLYCLMTKDGRVDWKWQTGGDVIGVPAFDDRHVYFVSLDNLLRSLDRVSGAQQWMKPLPVRPVWGPLKVVDRLFVGGQSATVHAFSLRDGRPDGQLDAGAELDAAPHNVAGPEAPLPVVMVVTRDIAKGAAARLVTRRIEPQANPLSDPLPNAIKMGAAAPTRP
jgi:eukaryotic-like serine/threonine-protein kinase